MVSAARLMRTLARSAVDHGCAAELTLATTSDWASATFVGMRCEIAASVDADGAERWAAALPDAELPMPRQFVREVRVVAVTRTGDRTELTIEVIVLED